MAGDPFQANVRLVGVLVLRILFHLSSGDQGSCGAMRWMESPQSMAHYCASKLLDRHGSAYCLQLFPQHFNLAQVDR